MYSSISSLVLLSLAASSCATVYITNPTTGNTLNGGQDNTVTWQDSNVAPLLKDLGQVTVALYAGTATQQAVVQSFPNKVAATDQKATINIDASLGPNGNNYLLRITSDNGTIAYSSFFSVQGMKGNFSPSIQSIISGAPQTPGASPSGSASGSHSGAPGPSAGPNSPNPNGQHPPGPSGPTPSHPGPVMNAATGSTPSGSAAANAASSDGPSIFAAVLTAASALFALF